MTELNSVAHDLALTRVLALETRRNLPVNIVDITTETTAVPVATGILDVELDLPRSARSADVFIFEVVDADGNNGRVVFTKRHSDDDD